MNSRKTAFLDFSDNYNLLGSLPSRTSTPLSSILPSFRPRNGDEVQSRQTYSLRSCLQGERLHAWRPKGMVLWYRPSPSFSGTLAYVSTSSRRFSPTATSNDWSCLYHDTVFNTVLTYKIWRILDRGIRRLPRLLHSNMAFSVLEIRNKLDRIYRSFLGADLRCYWR